MKYKNFPFTITIDDGFNEPKTFKMEFDGSVSMQDLIKSLEEKFQTQENQIQMKNIIDKRVYQLH